MRKIKIAQIGISRLSHGADIFECMKELNHEFEIVGYTLPENERERFPERMDTFRGFRELTMDEILLNPEIEAVAVETEEIYLTKYANLAAKHKKHIHMEKPGGLCLNEFEELIKCVKSNNTVFHLGYMYRYNPYIMRLMDRIKNGELGEIISVEAQMNCSHLPESRQWLESFPGGMMFFLGCHLVDLILQIHGKPENIIPLSKCSGVDGVTAEDFGMAVFEYKNGVSFAKAFASEAGGLFRRQLVVTGTKGCVEMRPIEDSRKYPVIISRYREVFDKDWAADANFHTTESYNRYNTMMSSFAAIVRGDKANPWNYDYELELYKTILKACGGIE